MKKFLNVFYGVFSILGCLLGAGFISGAEVVAFFVKFGWFGVFGIILSSVFFIVAICKFYTNEDNFANKKFDFMPYCQLLISGAMLSGLVKVVSEFINIDYYIVLFGAGVILFIVLVFGIKFANIFNILVSVATIIILPFVINNISIDLTQTSSGFKFISSGIYAALYSTINIVASMPVIKSVGSKNIKTIVVVSGAITCGLLLIIYLLLIGRTGLSDMPILDLITDRVLKALYTIVFVVAMLSTLFSASSGAKQTFIKLDNNILSSLCTSILILVVSFLGFGKIIDFAYPLIGIAILIQIILNKVYKKPRKAHF